MSAPPLQHRRRRRDGFGLIEVMVSGSLLVLGLAGVLSFAASTSVTAAHQRHVTVAAHVAEMQLEKLVLLAPDDARLTDGAHTGPRYDEIGNPAAAGRYKTSWDVDTDAPLTGARIVIVTVRWSDATGLRTTTLKTIRT